MTFCSVTKLSHCRNAESSVLPKIFSAKILFIYSTWVVGWGFLYKLLRSGLVCLNANLGCHNLRQLQSMHQFYFLIFCGVDSVL